MSEFYIKPQSGIKLEVSKGQKITITDVDGGQVADFFAEIKGTHDEYISPAVTIDCNESLHIGVGTVFYTNLYRPMFRVDYDDVEAHDMLFPACNKAMYDFFYQNGEGHSNCLDNINNALGTKRNIIHTINFFMNTKIAADGKVTIHKPLSKAGDRVVLTALEDCAVAVSACSVSECDTNSGVCTAISVRLD